MAKKILTAVLAAAMLMCLAGCSDYVMTAEDLAKQKSIEGCWAADDSTGYNDYDENGNITQMLVVEFTEDFKYMIHICDLEEGYVMTYDPIEYSFKDENFKVVVDGVASYARVSVNEDGSTMRWITDDKTDLYQRVSEEAAAALGIPEYDPESWNTEATSEDENGDVSESYEEDTDSGAAEAAKAAKAMTPAEPDPEEKDYHLLDYKLDPSVKFDISGENSDFTKNPVVIAETEDGEIVLYGIYIDGTPFVYIERDGSVIHDGMADIYERAWLTPRNILPQIMYSDIDSDGDKELAVSYYVGSGTGISVEELVIYEMTEGGYFASGADFEAAAMLKSEIACDIDNLSHTATFKFLKSGESVSYDTSEDYPNGLESIEWGSSIGYEFDGNDIILTAYPSANYLSYEGMPKITAKVKYTDGVGFGLEDITVDKEF